MGDQFRAYKATIEDTTLPIDADLPGVRAENAVDIEVNLPARHIELVSVEHDPIDREWFGSIGVPVDYDVLVIVVGLIDLIPCRNIAVRE